MVREKSEQESAETGRPNPRIGIPDHYNYSQPTCLPELLVLLMPMFLL